MTTLGEDIISGIERAELQSDLQRIEHKLDVIIAFQESLAPFVELARSYTQGNKIDRVRAMMRSGR